MSSSDHQKFVPEHRSAEQDDAQQVSLLHLSKEDAEFVAHVIRTCMREREERLMREHYWDLFSSACSFLPFPIVENMDYEKEADEIWRQSWQDAGDSLRLAMFDYAAESRK